jgi:hypothetical protein
MGSRFKRVDIFDVPDTDLERTKPLRASGGRRSTRGKQITPLTRTKIKRHYNTRSRYIGEQIQLEQKVRLGRKQKQSTLVDGKPKAGACIKLRRSTRLEAQRSKDVIST